MEHDLNATPPVSPPGELAERVERARTDRRALNTLLNEYMPFIKKCVASVFFKPDERRNNVAEAMLGFIQSVQTYRSESGAFIPYAQTVIRNRLLNAAAKETRIQKLFFTKTLSSSDNEEHSRLEYEITQRTYESTIEQESLRFEMAEINAEFAAWDFDVTDLAQHRPKQDRSRLACQRIARVALAHPDLVAEMKAARKLPVKKIIALTGCTEKLLEKYRRYIVALILILSGEYPYIQSFLPGIKEEL